MSSQGKQANRTGRILEHQIAALLSANGFTIIPHKEWIVNPDEYPAEVLVRDVPYISIYNSASKTEFLLISKKHDLRIRIECKWQDEKGSVDEKFPYLYLNCIESVPESDVIIVMDGKGMREGAKEWLRNACKNMPYASERAAKKNIQVMTISEFMSWANKTLR